MRRSSSYTNKGSTAVAWIPRDCMLKSKMSSLVVARAWPRFHLFVVSSLACSACIVVLQKTMQFTQGDTELCWSMRHRMIQRNELQSKLCWELGIMLYYCMWILWKDVTMDLNTFCVQSAEAELAVDREYICWKQMMVLQLNLISFWDA